MATSASSVARPTADAMFSRTIRYANDFGNTRLLGTDTHLCNGADFINVSARMLAAFDRMTAKERKSLLAKLTTKPES